MKKILETKKDYEKLQQLPRPGEKVRGASADAARTLRRSPHTSPRVGRIEILGTLQCVMGGATACPGGSGVKAKALFCPGSMAVPFLPCASSLPAYRGGGLAAGPWLVVEEPGSFRSGFSVSPPVGWASQPPCLPVGRASRQPPPRGV